MRDRCELVAVVSMDLSKAFGVIQHGLPLAKLKAYGIGEASCALLKDYLSRRQQRVKIRSPTGRTPEEEFLKGAWEDQCSLINVFINDLFQLVKYAKLNAYATTIRFTRPPQTHSHWKTVFG